MIVRREVSALKLCVVGCWLFEIGHDGFYSLPNANIF